MWKQIIDFSKSVAATYRRLSQAEENIKKLQESSNKHDTNQNATREMLQQVLHEFEKDRQRAGYDREIAERDREILILRLESVLKNDLRALPSGTPNATNTTLELRFESLEKQIAELNSRVEFLENRP